MKILLAILFFAVICIGAQQSKTVSHVKDLGDGTDIVMVDGEARIAINLAGIEQIKKDQSALHELQSVEVPKLNSKITELNGNLQGEKVKFAKKQQEYEGQVSVVADLAKALNHGGAPRALSDWRIDLGLKLAPTVTNFLRRCN